MPGYVDRSYATGKCTKDHKQMSAIYNWLEESTGLQARALPFTEALRYLVETQKLKHMGRRQMHEDSLLRLKIKLISSW
jgi:hypothetical protein